MIKHPFKQVIMSECSKYIATLVSSTTEHHLRVCLRLRVCLLLRLRLRLAVCLFLRLHMRMRLRLRLLTHVRVVHG